MSTMSFDPFVARERTSEADDDDLTSLTGEVEDQEQIRLVDSPEPPDSEEPVVMNCHDHQRDNYFATKMDGPKKVVIDRPVLTQADVFPKYSNTDDKEPGGCFACIKKMKLKPKKVLFSVIPILSWLPNYQWREVSYDAIAGFIVAVMNIPQGMAYALLGNLPPIVGIYMAFFPVIIYSILGTSRHISMGTFAVICLMSGKTALEFQHDSGAKYSIIEIATAISFAVGIIQGVMGVMRLGALSLLLNTELVSGFTTGAAVHVLTSQVKGLLGLSLKRRTGIFKIILNYVDIFENIHTSNIAAVIISVVTILVLCVYNELLKPCWMRRIRFPLPTELIIVVTGTLISYYCNFHTVYNIDIVDRIPTGLPVPTVPSFTIIGKIIFPDALIIAIVAYVISVSMAKIFANKHNYSIDPNQELVAQGSSNIVGSFFSCAPIAASLSRSLIQEQVGGRTQLASLFSCSLLLIVLLWIAPFFESLPNAVLSSIIVVALKGMFLQCKDLLKAWKLSKMNALIWLATFLSTVVLDIEYGLLIGFALSVLTLLWRSSKVAISELGAYGDTEIYVDAKANSQVHEISGVKILKCNGNLNFASAERFSHEFSKLVHLPSGDQKKTAYSKAAKMQISTISKEKITDDASIHNSEVHVGIERRIDYVIMDMSSVSSADPEASLVLKSLLSKCTKEEIKVLLCGCTTSVLTVLRTCGVIQQVGMHNIFPTVHDAVVSTGTNAFQEKPICSEVSSQSGFGESDSESDHPYHVLESSIKQHNLHGAKNTK